MGCLSFRVKESTELQAMATTHSKALGRRKQDAHITRKDIDQRLKPRGI